jgi:NAD(P)-dependent dehydrogenase (short-subunit alcohol dehydrogenase family)
MGIVQDRVAVVTGGGRGIGRAICLLLAEEGAKVVVNDPGVAVDGTGFDQRPADEVVEEIRRRGGVAVANYDSVATMEGGERIIRTAIDNFGRIDILVCCAGILRDRMIFNMTEEEWDEVIRVHLKGHFTVMKPASVLMRQQRYGRIITFTSTSGLIGNAGQANYGAAKSGIAGLTRVAALDLGRYGVTVNSIAPAANTRMTATIPDRARQLRQQMGTGASALLGESDHPAVTRRDPEDIAPMVVYLASEEAGWINGQVFYVGGGIVARAQEERPIRHMWKPERWTVHEIAGLIRSQIFDPTFVSPGLPRPEAQPAPQQAQAQSSQTQA